MKRILIHGLGQGADSWEQTAAGLPGETLCPELFSMVQGRAMTYENLYRAFCEYCDSAGEKVNLYGLSLGAVLGLHYAIEHPQAVERLALIGGRCRMPRGVLMLQSWMFRLMRASVFQELGMSKKDAICLMSTMARLDFTKDLSKVQCPVLVLCGGKDRVNRRDAEVMARGIAGARLQILPGVGHEVNRSAPQTLAALLKDFEEIPNG